MPAGGVVPTGGLVFSKCVCIYPLKKESSQYIYIPTISSYFLKKACMLMMTSDKLSAQCIVDRYVNAKND